MTKPTKFLLTVLVATGCSPALEDALTLPAFERDVTPAPTPTTETAMSDPASASPAASVGTAAATVTSLDRAIPANLQTATFALG